MRLFCWCLSLVLGCGDVPPQLGPFLSPDGEAVVQGARMLILLRLPNEMRFHQAEVFVDGQRQFDALVVVRKRWWEGKGTDLMTSISTVDLAPGAHVLSILVQAPRRGFFGEAEDRGSEWMEIEQGFRFEPRPARLTVKVVDQTGAPRAARVTVLDAAGEPVNLADGAEVLADPTERDIVRHGFTVPVGGATEFLELGEVQLIASGGIRDGIDQKRITLTAETEVQMVVPRLIDTPGEVTADLHVHTGLSADSFVGDFRRFHSLVAADVDVAVLTDHNRIRQARSALELLKLSDAIRTIGGVELRFGASGESVGHANAFPLKTGVKALQPGVSPPAEVMANWRRHHLANPLPGSKAPLLIQLNHPRGIQFKPGKRHREDGHALFNELSFDPRLPLQEQADVRLRAIDHKSKATALDFDVIEVLNRFSIVGWRLVREDWFQMMNRGRFPTGTGNSDTHTVEMERVGFPVNLVSVDDAGDLDGFVDAVRAGRLRVSSGPLVQMVVRTPEGTEAGPGQAVSTGSGMVEVEVRVDAVPWVPVHEVRVIVNGQLGWKHRLSTDSSAAEPAVHRGTWTLAVPIKHDSWIIAEAGWPLDDDSRPSGSVYAHVAPEHVPIGFVNPVRVDDGDGIWTLGGQP